MTFYRNNDCAYERAMMMVYARRRPESVCAHMFISDAGHIRENSLKPIFLSPCTRARAHNQIIKIHGCSHVGAVCETHARTEHIFLLQPLIAFRAPAFSRSHYPVSTFSWLVFFLSRCCPYPFLLNYLFARAFVSSIHILCRRADQIQNPY